MSELSPTIAKMAARMPAWRSSRRCAIRAVRYPQATQKKASQKILNIKKFVGGTSLGRYPKANHRISTAIENVTYPEMMEIMLLIIIDLLKIFNHNSNM